jgi:hypothetical protein
MDKSLMTEPFDSSVEKLLRFDLVRASKLLEISEFVILTFVMGFYAGSLIDYILPKYDPEVSNFNLVKDVVIQLVLVAVSAYYIKKISAMFPFMFSLTPKYIPSKKGEAAFGGAIAMAIIFISVQKNFIKKIDLLYDRFGIKAA